MLRKIGLGGLLLALVCTPCFGRQWAERMFKTTEHDFGAVAQGAKAEYKFVFENIYLEEVHVAKAYSSCGCVGVVVENPSLKTYQQGAIVARFNTVSFHGSRGATITVVFDRPFPAEVQLHLSGYIRSDVSVEPGCVELGAVDQGTAAEWNLSVSHVGRSDWRILEVKTSNPHISAQAVETGRNYGNVSYALKVHLDDDAPPGYLNDHIILITNDAGGGQIPVQVEGRVVPGVEVSPAALFMGVVQPGRTVTKQLVVKGKRPFRVLNVSCEDGAFRFQTPSDRTPKRLHLLPVTFEAGSQSGKVIETIRIETDGGETPEATAYAIVADAD